MADYFANQTITIISGGTPGGPTDTTARLFAQFAVKHFPGNPTFIVESLPGGGQLRALQAGIRARPDGFTAAVAHTRWAIGSILGADLSPYDVRTARFVGSPLAAARVGLVCADRNKFESWQAILDNGRSLQIGAELGARNILGATLVDLLDGPIESVYGYDGTAESAAAFDRGEVAGVACADDTVPELYPEWFENKRLTPLFYWGPEPDSAYLE
jgi:tripartite-type tricarboxylate transporter receptor subunit TctC